jgi:hypothetical protein
MCLLDYVFYMYWKQFDILPLGFASKLGLHPVAIAHLSPGTSSLLGSQISTGDSKEVGVEYTNAIHFRFMFYRCIMNKRTPLKLGLASRELFLLLSRPNSGSFTSCYIWLEV